MLPGHLGAIPDGCKLRDSNAGHNPGCADRARPYSHLNSIGPSLNQGLNRGTCGHIARDQIHSVSKLLLQLPQASIHPGVPMGGVDDQGVYPASTKAALRSKRLHLLQLPPPPPSAPYHPGLNSILPSLSMSLIVLGLSVQFSSTKGSQCGVCAVWPWPAPTLYAQGL